jgi:hypothetical protein
MNHVHTERILAARRARAGSRVLPVEASRLGSRVRSSTLVFEVTRDEEYVHLRMVGSGYAIDLGAKAHHYLLLTLARRRLADMAAGHADASCGWVATEELTRDPTMPPAQINLHVHRSRKQLAQVGLVDPTNIVERRAPTRELRIGTPNLHVIVT